MISLDVAATAVALAGLLEDPKLDGVKLVPYLRGEKAGAPHETLYWRWIAQSAVREGKWKYLRGGAREYLFDLDVDSEEQHNLLKQHPQIADRLKSKLIHWAKELTPPGLETKQMSTTWEEYFDHYLDGKSVSKPASASRASDKHRGWIVRNGTMEIKDRVLQVRPDENKRSPFLVTANLELPAKLTAVVRLKTEKIGGAGFAWRESGQKDFAAGQIVTFKCSASDRVQQYQAEIVADGKIIHMRLLLPDDGADVEAIEFRDSEGKVLTSTQFVER